jgi:hypothetical protein
MPAFITSPIAAPPLTYNDTTAPIAVGTRGITSDGGEAIFIQAQSENSQYAAVVIQSNYKGLMATTALVTEATGVGRRVGWAQASIGSGNYGWVQTMGKPIGRCATNCADMVALYTTSTAGEVDDAVVSIGLLEGVMAKTTISNATAVTLLVATPCFVGNMAVQA